MLSTPSPNSYSPKSPTHPLKHLPSPTPLPRISLRFLPTVTWKKGKTKKFKVLVLSPRGSMRWDTDGQGLLPLQPLPEPPPELSANAGRGRSQRRTRGVGAGGQRLRIWRSPGRHHSTWPLWMNIEEEKENTVK